MTTGKKPAKISGKKLADKKTSADVKTIAGSDLAQAPKKKKK